ncbi:hypothetical protein Tco_1534535 [Tanacetum coccineum]
MARSSGRDGMGRGMICTDIAKITRKRSKLDKHRHGNGKSAQEPGFPSKGQQSQPWSTIGQPTKRQNLKNAKNNPQS